MATKNTSLCLVGYGYWGQKIAKILRAASNKILVCDPNRKVTEAGFAAISFEEILANNRLNNIFLVTPEQTHFDLAQTLLTQGKNVFIEKPLALKKNEAEILCELATSQKKLLFCDYIFLFDEYVLEIKKILGTAKLGTLQKIHSVRHSVGFHKEEIDVSDDLFIHDLYLGEYFFSRSASSVKALKTLEKGTQVVKGEYEVQFGEGRTLMSNCSWIDEQSQREIIFNCEKGKLIWKKNKKGSVSLFQESGGTRIEKKVIEKTSPLEKSIEYFLQELPQETDEMRAKRYQDYIRHVAMLESVRGSHSTL